jgi:antigen flippase
MERAKPAELGIEAGALLGIIGSGAGLVFSILRSKITAIVLGPAGMGQSAQILQLVAMANLPVGMVTGPALVSGIAEARGRGDHAAIARIVRTATTVVIAVSTLTGLIAVLVGLWTLPAPWGRGAWPLTLLAATAALLSAWAMIPQQALTAHVELRRLTVLRLAIAAISVAFACAGTILFGLTGQFIALALSALAALPIALLYARRSIDVPWAPRPEVDRAFVIRAMRFGLSSFVAGLAAQGAITAIFQTLERHAEPASAGQFTAAWTIGATYFGLLLEGVGTYVSPRYAAAQSEEALAHEMDNAGRFVFKTAPPFLLAAIVLRAPIVHALYDDRYPGAIELVGLQMVADMCRAISWVQAGPLLYRNKVRAFLFVEISAQLILGLGAVILVPIFGLVGVGYAYLGMWIFYLLVSAVVVHKSCGVPLNARRVGLSLLFTAAAFAVLLLERAFALTRWVVLAGVLVWWYRTGMLQSFLRRGQRKLDAIRGRAQSPPAGVARDPTPPANQSDDR